MTTIRDIMTRDVTTLQPEMSLRDALEALAGKEISGAPVIEGRRVVAVLSVTDIIEFQATNPGVPTLRPEQSDGGGPGEPERWVEGDDSPSSFFVDFWSDAGSDVTTRLEEDASPEWDLLAEHLVAEVMTRGLVSLTPVASVRSAARVMVDAEVQRILVLEDGELHGIVTATDVVRAVADGKV